MPAVARVGDPWQGICHCHDDPINVTGEIISGSSDATSGGKAIARIGDIVQATCGHTGPIATGSSVNKTNGIGKAFVGSETSGCLEGTIISGNPNHITS